MSVLVTGAASGIGKATAKLLAERAFKVAVTDVDQDAARRVAEEVGGFGTVLDVTSRQSILRPEFGATFPAEAMREPVTWASCG
ncbi:MAG: SDR family NAD(P)-dependent oxidoreductase [Acidimicrobiales bacterium]|jgi:NAD(P)-dependent dehydrogenase (short-subunit alcohol dehydrogenase family)